MRTLLLRSALASIGVCAIVLFFAQNIHEPPALRHEAKEVPVLNHDDFVSLAKNVYFEARGESEEGQRFVADVTLRRWRSHRPEFGGPTIRDVVYHKTTKVVRGRKITTAQFSWSPKDPIPQDPVRWAVAQRIAREAWDAMLTLDDASPDVMWYMNPEKSDPRGRRWFRRKLIPVGYVGRHEAFREPTIGEKLQLMAAWAADQLHLPQMLEKKAPKKKPDKKRK